MRNAVLSGLIQSICMNKDGADYRKRIWRGCLWAHRHQRLRLTSIYETCIDSFY